MGAPTAANVEVGVTGAIYYAPLGTSLPTTATASLPAAFKEVGYISEDGVTFSQGADSSDIKAWQNGDVVRKVQTSHDYTVQFVMIETSDEVLKLYYNDPAATIASTAVSGAQSPHQVFVLEMLDGKKVKRIVIEDGQVAERGDQVWKGDTPVGYDITLSCYPGADGKKAHIYEATVGG